MRLPPNKVQEGGTDTTFHQLTCYQTIAHDLNQSRVNNCHKKIIPIGLSLNPCAIRAAGTVRKRFGFTLAA